MVGQHVAEPAPADSPPGERGGGGTEWRPANRRAFLRNLALAAASATAAGVFPRAASAASAAERARAKAVVKATRLRRQYRRQAQESLDESLARQEIGQANAAADATLQAAAAPLGYPLLALGPLTLPQTGQVASQAADPVTEDALARMEADLKRALAKPVEQRRWAMVIDARKCIGCSACTVACKAENKLPPGVVYRPVLVEEVGTFPNVTMRFIPRPCMHCENPPCVKVCPVGATFKRPDGIVAIDYDVCIGCRYCLAACPYQARTFDWGLYYTSGTPELEQYETVPSFEYEELWPREGLRSPIDNARKCHFCLHRLDAGMLPMCVTTCLGRATYFGDQSDPKSLVSELIAQPNAQRLKEELGTDPKVYYLV